MCSLWILTCVFLPIVVFLRLNIFSSKVGQELYLTPKQGSETNNLAWISENYQNEHSKKQRSAGRGSSICLVRTWAGWQGLHIKNKLWKQGRETNNLAWISENYQNEHSKKQRSAGRGSSICLVRTWAGWQGLHIKNKLWKQGRETNNLAWISCEVCEDTSDPLIVCSWSNLTFILYHANSVRTRQTHSQSALGVT